MYRHTIRRLLASLRFITVVGVAVYVFPVVQAQDGDTLAIETMKKVYNQLDKHKQLKFDVEMNILNENEEVRRRLFTSWKKKIDDETKILMRFFSPNNVKGTGLLTVRNEGGIESNQKIYLPALRRLLNISGSEKNKSFMGSDFTNDDIGGRSLGMDTHTVFSQSENKKVIKSIPVSETSPYTHFLNEIDTTRWVVVSVEYYDKEGKLKTLLNKKIDNVDGMFIPVESTMTHHRRGSKTNMAVTNIDTKLTISNRFFGAKGLRR